LNKITDLKGASKRETKFFFCKGVILKEFFAEGKTKLAYFAGG
jgi:hypothetical protein